MAETLQTPDGRLHVILNEDYFSELVDDYMGRECGQYLKETITLLKEKASYATQAVNTDLNSYEEELNSNRYAFEDIATELDTIEKLIDSRLNRKALAQAVKNIRRIISNQI